MRYVKIPADRIGAVIGPDGRTRRFIERRAGVKIEIDSADNEVHIDDAQPEDPLGPLHAEDVVKAIGRGFNPDRAFRLFSDDQYLQIFDMRDYVGKNKKDVHRIASRVIGAEGKTRRLLEELTGCHVSVYGHTVAIIGDAESMDTAANAVDLLLNGSEHANVYRYLEGKRRQAKRARMEL